MSGKRREPPPEKNVFDEYYLNRCYECGRYRYEHMPPITHFFVEEPA